MKKFAKYIFAFCAVFLTFSCQEEILVSDKVQDGYISVRFMTDVAVMEDMCTRAVDPDGGGVHQDFHGKAGGA